jgi:hypothetical protein
MLVVLAALVASSNRSTVQASIPKQSGRMPEENDFVEPDGNRATLTGVKK